MRKVSSTHATLWPFSPRFEDCKLSRGRTGSDGGEVRGDAIGKGERAMPSDTTASL